MACEIAPSLFWCQQLREVDTIPPRYLLTPLRQHDLGYLGREGSIGGVAYTEELHDHTAKNRLGHSNRHGIRRAFEKWTVTLPSSQKSMASVAYFLYPIASRLS